MIRTLNSNQPAAPAPCPCQLRRAGMGDVTETLAALFMDWKNLALIAAVAVALYFAFQSTPQSQERAVQRRKARAAYKAQLERIRQS